MRKKPPEISSLDASVPEIMIICYTLPEIWHDRCNLHFSFWAIFCPFTPLTAQKTKIKKKEKSTWRYHHFIHVYQKLLSHDVRFPRYSVRWRDEWTDGQTDRKSDIQRWVPHLKINQKVFQNLIPIELNSLIVDQQSFMKFVCIFKCNNW